MKKLILFVVIVLSIFSGCNKNEEPYYSQPNAPLNDACEHEGAIYFIYPQDNKLYKFCEDYTIKQVLDEEMSLFTYTKDYLVYLNNASNLALYNLTNGEKRTIKWDVQHISESAIYDDRIVYINDDDELVVMGFDGEVISKVDSEVTKIRPYQDRICYTIKNGKLSQMTIMQMDLNGNYRKEMTESWVYRMRTSEDWIYYVNDNYSLYRFSSIEDRKEKIVDYLDWFEFEVMDNCVVARQSDDLIICDLNGNNVETIEPDIDNVILDADNNIVVYQEHEKNYIGIYHALDKAISKVHVSGAVQDCVILQDLIYIASDNDGGFYTFNGDQVYSF